MSETADWKQKYRDSLREIEAEEKRWREIEQVLRRLIGRLCAAGMGVDPQLDDELAALAAANRRNADALQLEKLAESLTIAVTAVDATAPVLKLAVRAPHPTEPQPAASAPRVLASSPLASLPGASTPHDSASGPRPAASRPHTLASAPRPAAFETRAHRWDSTCAALGALLARLETGEADPTLRGLADELAEAETDAALAVVVTRTADLIHERGESLARERQRAAAVLSEVTQRLEEMSSYLLESDSANRSRFDDTQSLNDTMMSHVRELTDEVSGATDLGLLQSTVNARLESVARQICDFRSREASRVVELNGRTEHMRERIADLEREAQDLHARLDLEKHGARLDPLTGIANRKSFAPKAGARICV